MSSVSCSCGECKLTLNENRPVMSLYCACKDCAQAIRWGELRGGKASLKLPQSFYVRSDIIYVEGDKFMKAFQLRKQAKSTRVYCTKCYSLLGVDHPSYENNVFMIYPQHCNVELDLSVKPCAAINMASYAHEEKPDLPADIPVFHEWGVPQERERFYSVPDVGRAFSKPLKPAVGQTFAQLIVSLGDIKVLNLEADADSN